MRPSLWLCLAGCAALACAGDSGPLEVEPPEAVPATASPVPSGPATRWVLVYAGSRKSFSPSYSVNQFRRLITHVDTLAQPQYWVFSGAIFLHLYAPSGRTFATWIGGVPATGADWSDYLDSLFVPRAALARLDSMLTLAQTAIGPPPLPFRVSIMIPYPAPSIGMLEFGGRAYDFATEAGRADAVAAYVSEAVRRFQAAGYKQLHFDGFYWLLECAPPSDLGVISRLSAHVHANGTRLLWIPYYGAENWNRWAQLGFDAAWLQPNYFFDPGLAPTRLDSAAALAEQGGLGMQVEFDGRIWVESVYHDRLQPYLATLALWPQLRAREVAVYEGAGALLRMGISKVPEERALYQTIGDALR